MFRNAGRARSEGARSRALAAVLWMALAPSAAAATGQPDPTVTVIPRGEVYEIRGSFTAPVAPGIAWDVLTDYARIPEFVSSMKASRVESRDGNRVRLHQRATAGALVVRRTVEVVLEVVEDPEWRIAFTDVQGGDFRLYTGAWTLKPAEGGADVRYALVVRPRAALPGFLGRNIMRGSVRRLLAEVRDEMIRRQMSIHARSDSTPSPATAAVTRPRVLAREP